MCKLRKKCYIPIDERWRTQNPKQLQKCSPNIGSEIPGRCQEFSHRNTRSQEKTLHFITQFSTALCQLYQDLVRAICVTQRWVLTWTLNYGNAAAPPCGFLFEIHTWTHRSSNLYLSLCNWDRLKAPQKHVLLSSAFSKSTSPLVCCKIWMIHYPDSVHCSLLNVWCLLWLCLLKRMFSVFYLSKWRNDPSFHSSSSSSSHTNSKPRDNEALMNEIYIENLF